MKKLLLALLLFLLPTAAHAGVPCSVPFNLTNGTTADATQVMANYNAILSCLSTSTAANGANADITSLGALTTPITPAQGGAQALCGASGFVAKNDVTFPNTSVDITYGQAVVTNPLNAVQYGISGSLVLNFSTTGVDGLDTGTQAANTTYYTYLIGNGSAIHSLASLSSTAPTMPGGYTFLCRVGSLRTQAASTNLYSFYQQGRTVSITQNITATDFSNVGTNGNCSTNTYTGGVFTGLPATAGFAVGYIASQNATGTIVVARAAAAGGVATLTNMGAAVSIRVPYTVPLPTASTIFWCNDTATNQFIVVNGWVDSINVN